MEGAELSWVTLPLGVSGVQRKSPFQICFPPAGVLDALETLPPLLSVPGFSGDQVIYSKYKLET